MYAKEREYSGAADVWTCLSVSACGLWLLLLATAVNARVSARTPREDAGRQLASYVATARQEIAANEGSLDSSLRRFRRAHPRIAAIRVRDSRGTIVAESGVALGLPLPTAARAPRLWRQSTESGDVVVAAFPLHQAAILEIAAYLHAPEDRRIALRMA
jgi:hypothetical protein